MLTSLDDAGLGRDKTQDLVSRALGSFAGGVGGGGSGKGRLRRGARFKPNGMYGIFYSGVLINNLTLLSSLQS